MSRSTIISLVLCLGVSIALFGWLFFNEPMPELTRVNATGPSGKISGSPSATKKVAEVKPVGQGQRKVEFSESKSKATALNNEPVNIVINPGSQKVQLQAGSGDLVVTSSGLRMRSAPTSQSELLGKYARGARFAHIRDENGWALVQSLDDGKKGWMFKKYMGKAGG